VLPIAEADKIRKMSRATRDDAPWKLWPEEMYKKAALRRLCKVLPSGRDMIPPSDADELPQLDAPSPPLSPAAAKPVRAAGAAAALATFAASPAAPGDTSAAAEDAASAPAVAEPSSKLDHAPAAAPPEHAEAFKRGIADKAAGKQRRAIPGEFRDNTRLALCWQAGFDGDALPQFEQEG